MTEPQTYQERRNESIKSSNHHILTCNDENWVLHNEKVHNYQNLFKRYMEYSYSLYPKKENEGSEWISPTFKTTLFSTNQQYEATFTKPVPTEILDDLANEAKQQTC
jgi:hypothetical protein